MPAHPLSDLLPIPEGVVKPNAYDVFGITPGALDDQRIQATIRSVIEQLKSKKKKSDPKQWKAAARLATEARELLNDPHKREKLDQRLANASQLGSLGPVDDNASSPSHQQTDTDPLAGLLPNADPLAPYQPILDQTVVGLMDQTKVSLLDKTDIALLTPKNSSTLANPTHKPQNENSKSERIESVTESPPEFTIVPPAESLLPHDSSLLPQERLDSIKDPSLAASDDHDSGSIELPAFDGNAPSFGNAGDVTLKKPNTKLRRRSKTGMLVPAVFAVCCFGIVGLALYFIINKPGVVVTVSNDGVAVNSAEQNENNEDNAVVDNVPVGKKPKPPVDPVMGSLGPPSEKTTTENNDQKLTDPIPETTSEIPNPATESMPNENPGTNKPDNPEGMQSNDANSAPIPDLTQTLETPADPPMKALSDDILQKADQTLAAATSAIKSADWDQMNLIANSMLDQEMSPEQKSRANELFQIIDLAVFYRIAIIDSIAKLNTGDDFEVTTDFRVIVVEKTPASLTVRYNTKNKMYSIDELPWSLAHKLASFEVGSKSFSTAAKSVYQFIAPLTNDELKVQSLDWIKEIQTDLDGTDKENIAATLKSL